MHLNSPTIAICVITVLGTIVAIPVLFKGFTRRGTGVKYEQNFLIQRAPQFISLMNVGLIVVSFCHYVGLIVLPPEVKPLSVFLMSLTVGEPAGVVALISWLGVLLLLSGMIFMVGGWYSLGDCFSTDAEVLDGHTVHSNGLLKYVMHPAYSGIIQCLLGASLAATSLFSALFCILVVAPLWLKRAKYEEELLLESLGSSYRNYAEQTHWRRLIPWFIPIGV